MSAPETPGQGPDVSETPAQKRARLRQERALRETERAAEREALLAAAVEAELDLRAAGPASEVVVDGAPRTRIAIAMDRTALLAAHDATTAAARKLLADAGPRTAAKVLVASHLSRPYWARQHGDFIGAPEDLTVGTYSTGDSSTNSRGKKKHETSYGAVLAIRSVDGVTRYLDVETRAEAAVPEAIQVYAAAQAEVLARADDDQDDDGGAMDHGQDVTSAVLPAPAEEPSAGAETSLAEHAILEVEGPMTPFVAIQRALDLARAGKHATRCAGGGDALGNALANILRTFVENGEEI